MWQHDLRIAFLTEFIEANLADTCLSVRQVARQVQLSQSRVRQLMQLHIAHESESVHSATAISAGQGATPFLFSVRQGGNGAGGLERSESLLERASQVSGEEHRRVQATEARRL